MVIFYLVCLPPVVQVRDGSVGSSSVWSYRLLCYYRRPDCSVLSCAIADDSLLLG